LHDELVTRSGLPAPSFDEAQLRPGGCHGLEGLHPDSRFSSSIDTSRIAIVNFSQDQWIDVGLPAVPGRGILLQPDLDLIPDVN
jgi:hypothetical protein